MFSLLRSLPATDTRPPLCGNCLGEITTHPVGRDAEIVSCCTRVGCPSGTGWRPLVGR